MSLTPGVRFGPYEIVAAAGAGGTGEVYRARDTRLDRTVALKILPGADPDRRARFEREARSVAALSHPHICTLHDVGRNDGIDFLVMEFVDGVTLASRLAGGPLPIDEALRIAVEVASALDHAHRHGIVHRDLKPGNIMLARSGKTASGASHAKLLDFGLAKAMASEVGAAGTSADMTRTAPLTTEGSLLGTPQYMSPEQVEGVGVDARSDLFAFGAVLFEMLTGRRPFRHDPGRADRCHPPRRSAARLRPAAAGDAGPRSAGRALSGEEPGRPVADRARPVGRAAVDSVCATGRAPGDDSWWAARWVAHGRGRRGRRDRRVRCRVLRRLPIEPAAGG